MVAGIKHEGSRKLKGDNLVGGTVSPRVHNLSDSMEYVREHQSLENGAEEKAPLPFFAPSNLEPESRTVMLLFTPPVWVPFTGLNSHCQTGYIKQQESVQRQVDCWLHVKVKTHLRCLTIFMYL